MEKFMLIFHGGALFEASPEQMQEHMGKWFAWIEKLGKADQYVGGEALIPGGKLVTSKKKTIDGPYTEGKEVVGGYFIVNANNIDEVVKMCDDYPDFEFGGTIQVRQVMKMDM
jgi:hypothetical protein